MKTDRDAYSDGFTDGYAVAQKQTDILTAIKTECEKHICGECRFYSNRCIFNEHRYPGNWDIEEIRKRLLAENKEGKKNEN